MMIIKNKTTGWWLKQPIWKICSSNWESSLNRVIINNIWNHHLVFQIMPISPMGPSSCLFPKMTGLLYICLLISHIYIYQPSIYHGPQKHTFSEVLLWYITWVFTWPKPLFFHGHWGLMVFISVVLIRSKKVVGKIRFWEASRLSGYCSWTRVQEISNRTHWTDPEKTWVFNISIATLIRGPLVRSHAISDGHIESLT